MGQTLKLPVFALSQFSREFKHRENKRPSINDLKDSGAIENDAHVILLLHRESAFQDIKSEDRTMFDDEAELIVAKVRQSEEP